MKHSIYIKIIISTMLIFIIAMGCEKNGGPSDPGTSTTELLSKKVTTAPAIDGSVENVWLESQLLITEAIVPFVEFDNFNGYVGNTYNVSMRSMYDDSHIYFLAMREDPTLDASREPWYFNPTDKRWKQESRYPTFDGSGNMMRGPFYEDKFALLFNVDNSIAGWTTASCYASCHSVSDEQKVRHYTNQPDEYIDMWHWKSVRTEPNGQFDDQYQSYVDGGGNGRHSDDKVSGGYTNNRQTITITGTSEEVSVPLYFIPDREDYHWILQSEIDAGTTKQITAVDANGVLTYDGGTIDPNVMTDFQRNGSGVGKFGIPSIYTQTLTGSRGDITSSASYTGTGWVLEFKRKLTVESPLGQNGDKQDVDFGNLEDQVFGLGVFDNAAIAHAIQPGLVLSFEQ
jgi:hypothetical protein